MGVPVLREIVGVARQVRMRANELEPTPQLYVPIAQNSWFIASLSVRSQTGAAEALLPAVRAAVARVDKEWPVTRVRTIDVVAAEATSRPRFRAVLVCCSPRWRGPGDGWCLRCSGVLGRAANPRIGVRIAMGARGLRRHAARAQQCSETTPIGLAIG